MELMIVLSCSDILRQNILTDTLFINILSLEPKILTFIFQDFLNPNPIQLLDLLFMNILLQSFNFFLVISFAFLHLLIKLVRVTSQQTSKFALIFKMLLLHFLLMPLHKLILNFVLISNCFLM